MGTGADLLSLQGRTVTMLRTYIEVAEKTCSLLDQIKSFPIGADVRETIRRQRVKENEAQEVYEIARKNLFNAARWE